MTDEKIPAVNLVRRPNGYAVRLEMNGSEFPYWISVDEPLVYTTDQYGAGRLTLTILVSGYTETEEVDERQVAYLNSIREAHKATQP
jgi:hypothetical protein